MPVDTREFTVPRDYLNAWCASQPERSSHDLVAGEPATRLILLSWQGFQVFRLPLKKKKFRT